MKAAKNVLWARLCEKPAFIPTGRPRGAKAAGLRFERRLAKEAGKAALAGQWFEFEDDYGVRYCQPDVIVPFRPRFVAIVEAKYTLVDEAFDQLLDLYLPVVEAVWNCPVALVAAFKNFPSNSRLSESETAATRFCVHSELEEAAMWSVETGRVALLHWVGQPLRGRQNPRTAKIITHLAGRAA